MAIKNRLFFKYCIAIFSLLIFISGIMVGQGEEKENVFSSLKYRNLGPFRAGAWISDIAVPESDLLKYKKTFYVAARNGGVWKTVNNGTTYFPIFDKYGVNAIGAVEVAPSNPEHIWVGTGENSNSRSSYHGNGIYRSVNGGKSFMNMGLKNTQHIGRIIIHPDNSDIVYIASMGNLFSNNKQRGVFKTIDGGKNWKKILYINDKVGVVDLCIDVSSPETLFAASYDKKRTAWHYEAGGVKSRIYKSIDSGKTWKVLTKGLPKGKIGRIGIDIHLNNTKIIYAVIQNLNPKSETKNSKIKFDEFTDHSYDNLIGGEVYRSDDGGENWNKVSDPKSNVSGKAAYSFNEITVDPKDPSKVYITGVSMMYSLDSGKTWSTWRNRKFFVNNFGDVRTFWINPEDPDHMMLGSDGGIYQSWDGGKTTLHSYQIPLGEVYIVEIDDQNPYNIYAGLQDHEVWMGPSNGWSGSVGLEDWVIVGMWDGMYSKIEPNNNKYLYFTTQFGKHHRVDMQKGQRFNITPKAEKGKPFYRYTWTTPLVLSPHNSNILYTGGQYLLRSLNRGKSWEKISPDLTRNDPVKIAGLGHIMFCSITTISESAKKPGIIWIGTDDGRVHVTKNHGADWKEFTSKIKKIGGPEDLWVSRVLASKHKTNTAYVIKTGYRNDIYKAFVFKTDDLGKSWKNISSNLPDSPVSVIYEDLENFDLLFAGTDKGVFFSYNRGKEWISLKNNMPPVPVKDLLIHPREKDLIIGTYGRGVWITNISPLQQFNKDIFNMDFHLFDINDKSINNRSDRSNWGNYNMTGDNHLRTANEKEGLHIFYYIGKIAKNSFELIVKDFRGKQLRIFPIKNKKGINKIIWRPEDRKSGTYFFTLRAGKKFITKEGTLKNEIYWPLLNIK